MKQKILFALLAVACLVGCGSDEEGVVNISSETIAAMWDVTATNDGSGWVTCDSSRVVLSEDGYCMTMGRLFYDGSIHGKYSFYENTATLRDDDGAKTSQCVFTEVRKHTASAVFSFPDNRKMELRMERNETQPLMYKDAVKYLQGRWTLMKSRDYRKDVTIEEEIFVEFSGSTMSIQIGNKLHHSAFHRINNFIIATTDEKYIIRSASPKEIDIDNGGITRTFRRE